MEVKWIFSPVNTECLLDETSAKMKEMVAEWTWHIETQQTPTEVNINFFELKCNQRRRMLVANDTTKSAANEEWEVWKCRDKNVDLYALQTGRRSAKREVWIRRKLLSNVFAFGVFKSVHAHPPSTRWRENLFYHEFLAFYPDTRLFIIRCACTNSMNTSPPNREPCGTSSWLGKKRR